MVHLLALNRVGSRVCEHGLMQLDPPLIRRNRTKRVDAIFPHDDHMTTRFVSMRQMRPASSPTLAVNGRANT